MSVTGAMIQREGDERGWRSWSEIPPLCLGVCPQLFSDGPLCCQTPARITHLLNFYGFPLSYSKSFFFFFVRLVYVIHSQFGSFHLGSGKENWELLIYGFHSHILDCILCNLLYNEASLSQLGSLVSRGALTLILN